MAKPGKTGLMRITIFNLSGQILKSEEWEFQNRLLVSDLPEGVYAVKIENRHGEFKTVKIKKSF